ncbi:hypothetical protein FCU42_03500 [Vibrio parahaemolyticus]|uniref:restriction endonuclease subunit S n=1 Tax=Vibrio parahaemolyticus TaxID=670 RepID=UPI001593D3AC|nr:restriction endonuclease subunit S [Vibrio parahaemolyticus]EKA7363836.1 restriction endonuclease subunit S [Vibrio parahaemolyticus]NVC26300.1 hypothetical protein [Vibrio parahaemolyticus]
MTVEYGFVSIGTLLEKGIIESIQDGNHGGKHPKASDYVESGIPFIMANNLNLGYVDVVGASKISEEQANGLRIGFAKSGDVLLTHKGTIGNTALVHDVEPYIMLTPQVTYYRVDQERLDNHYLLYCFRDTRFQKVIKSLAQQSTRPYIGITAQRNLEIYFRPIEQQKRIVSFVRPYDDLIENNRRRIQLLEESARLLYQEWFVHLRFPGYEQVTIIDGVPDGWDKKTLKSIATLNYGKALKADNRVPGPYPVYGSSGEVGFHDKALVEGPGIVVGRKGNVGSVFWVNNDFFPIDTVYFINKEEGDLFLYHALKNVQFINTDVAVPGLNRELAYSREILVPDKMNYQRFLSEVEPIQAQINKLQDYNKKLAQARDLLLPRLMSGELSI